MERDEVLRRADRKGLNRDEVRQELDHALSQTVFRYLMTDGTGVAVSRTGSWNNRLVIFAPADDHRSIWYETAVDFHPSGETAGYTSTLVGREKFSPI